MAGSPAEFPLRLCAQDPIHIFERAIKARERVFQVGWTTPHGLEIVAAELIRARDHRCSHGAILVRSLRPREFGRGIDPERESHCHQYITML